jgi:hypothetical protein
VRSVLPANLKRRCWMLKHDMTLSKAPEHIARPEIELKSVFFKKSRGMQVARQTIAVCRRTPGLH